MGIDCARAKALFCVIGDNEQMQAAMLHRITPGSGLAGGDVLDQGSQGWPAEILVLDVDKLGRVVDGLQVKLFDIPLAFLGLGAQQLSQLPGGAGQALKLWPHLLGLP
ncbi:hypothetical protein D3C84_772880 [compost metagenome]